MITDDKDELIFSEIEIAEASSASSGSLLDDILSESRDKADGETIGLVPKEDLVESTPDVVSTLAPDVLLVKSLILEEIEKKTFNTSIVFGRKLIAEISGEDAKYADSEQFKLEKNSAGWVIVPLSAKNATFLNGNPIDAESVLSEGDIISIGNPTTGNQKLNIKVSFSEFEVKK